MLILFTKMSLLDLDSGTDKGVNFLDLVDSKSSNNDIYMEFNKDLDIYLSDSSLEAEYDVSSILDNVHWGQLKLFLSEFCAMIYDLDENIDTVLYIGAANGSHIYVLAQLFENLTFYLYDTERFDKRLYSLKNIKIFKKYFNDTDMKKWMKRDNVFLISDIRTLTYDPGTQTDKTKRSNEESVWSDMKLQEHWIKNIKPDMSLVKFRLPFAYDFILEEGRTRNYLDGKVYFQAYNKPTSSESRLLIKDISYKDWDLIEYERKLYYHNSVSRNKLKFFNPINEKKEEIYPEKGLLNDFDSTYLTVAVIDFLIKSGEVASESNVKNKLDYILQNISPGKANIMSKRAGF